MPKLSITELRRIVRLHMNWLLMATLGKDAITAEEYEELQKYGKLPMESLDLAESSFILGRLKSLLKSSEYKDITYEQLKDERRRAGFSDSERLATEHAKLTAAANLQRVQDEIAAGIYDQFAALSGKILTEETIRQVVRDEVVSALEQRKTAQQLASELAATFQDNKKDWLKVARTELHRAKMMGVAQAIANKYGPYSSGDGPDSNVIVVPGPQCCEDCAAHYLDANGNPKVFKLSELLSAGSNADPGVSHKKRNGIHIHWKTTMPPLHPNCGCTVQYLPPGTVYQGGKLLVKSLEQFQEAIIKSDDGIGNPVAKPPGPPQPAKMAKPGSIPGMDAPGRKKSASTGASTGGGRPRGPKGPEVDYVPKDSVDKRPAGTIGETEHSYKVVRGMKDGKAPTKEQQAIIAREKVKDAIAWGTKTKDAKVKIQHYTTGKIAYSKSLGELANENISDGGLDKSKLRRVTIEGNGRALQKPPHDWEAERQALRAQGYSGAMRAAGIGSVPHGRGHHHEVGAYKMHTVFGLHDHVPVAAIRHEPDGTASSMSEWLEGHEVTPNALREHMTKSGQTNMAAAVLAKCPADKRDALRTKLEEHIVMSLVLNDNDANWHNTMINEDFTDVKAIDKTFTGGNSFDGNLSCVFGSFHRNGMKVRIPDRLNERMSKTTFNDMLRGADGHYQDWQVAQTFLRTRYLQAVQEKHGHLPFNMFKPTILGEDGTVTWHESYSANGDAIDDELLKRVESKTTPSDIFNSWAKKFLHEASSDANHPDHHSAKQIVAIGPFMESGYSMRDPSAYRRSGAHKQYEKTIIPRDIPDDPSSLSPGKEYVPPGSDDDTTKVGTMRPRDGEDKTEAASPLRKKASQPGASATPPPSDGDDKTKAAPLRPRDGDDKTKAARIRKGLWIRLT